MKEEWLMPGAVVPVDPDTTKALVDEIKRLIGIIGGMALQAAAPVQEPVAWVTGFYAGRCVIKTINPAAILPVGVALYTTPPAAQRQHLTDGSLCWCEPETSYTDPETGASVVVHKGPQ